MFLLRQTQENLQIVEKRENEFSIIFNEQHFLTSFYSENEENGKKIFRPSS